MAYDKGALSLIAGDVQSPVRVYAYRSADGVATVRDGAYFTDGYWRGMRRGDVVHVQEVHASTGAVEAHQICIVVSCTKADGANVSDGTAISLTNTDS